MTPGLKAFPSYLIDNNALARTFLPGRAGTTGFLAADKSAPTVFEFQRMLAARSAVERGGGFIGLARCALDSLQAADRWRGGYDRQQSWLSVNSLPFCVTVDERSPSSSTSRSPS